MNSVSFLLKEITSCPLMTFLKLLEIHLSSTNLASEYLIETQNERDIVVQTGSAHGQLMLTETKRIRINLLSIKWSLNTLVSATGN
jgi:hypothetical protein